MKREAICLPTGWRSEERGFSGVGVQVITLSVQALSQTRDSGNHFCSSNFFFSGALRSFAVLIHRKESAHVECTCWSSGVRAPPLLTDVADWGNAKIMAIASVGTCPGAQYITEHETAITFACTHKGQETKPVYGQLIDDNFAHVRMTCPKSGDSRAGALSSEGTHAKPKGPTGFLPSLAYLFVPRTPGMTFPSSQRQLVYAP